MYEAVEQVSDGLREQFARLAAPGSTTTLTTEDRVAQIEACQHAINTLSAIQDLHLAHLAATEDVPCEDGTVLAVEHPLGSTRLDAAALVSGPLGLTDLGAERRVDDAIWLSTDGRIALDAKGTGRLDQFRASILAEELRDADPEVAQAVLAKLQPCFGSETAGPLRRRTRRAINRVAPEILRLKAARARGDRRLERWAGEPGMDHWLAVLPADQAGPAYAAIDRRAHERVSAGLNETIDNARADALLELILGNCVGTVGVQFAVPTTLLLEHAVEDAEAATMDPGKLISVEGLSAIGPVHLRRSSLQALVNQLMSALTQTPTANPANKNHDTATAAPVPSPAAAVATAAAPAAAVDTAPAADLDAAAATTDLPATLTATLVGCHPTTGAITTVPLDPSNLSKRINTPQLTSEAHDAPLALQELIRARDRHCRFPGCSITARFCDLDHVVAWPSGPTSAANLICLCRRHHRIKQRPGWHAQLHPDGTVTWTDPTGRHRTTMPTNYLDLENPAHENPAHENPAHEDRDREDPGHQDLDQANVPPARKALRPNTIDPSEPTEIPFRHARPRPQHPGIPQTYECSPDYFSHLEHALEHLLAEAEALTKSAAREPASKQHATARPAPEDDPPPF